MSRKRPSECLALNDAPLNQTCKRLLLKAKRDPDPLIPYSVQLAEMGLEQAQESSLSPDEIQRAPDALLWLTSKRGFGEGNMLGDGMREQRVVLHWDHERTTLDEAMEYARLVIERRTPAMAAQSLAENALGNLKPENPDTGAESRRED